MSEKNATLVVDLGFSSAKYMFNGKKGRVPSAFRSKVGGYTGTAKRAFVFRLPGVFMDLSPIRNCH